MPNAAKSPDAREVKLAALLAAAEHALRTEGALQRARTLHEQAAHVAFDIGDIEALAEAVAGLSGFWLHEQRDTIAEARTKSWRRLALGELPPESSLAVRLRVRDSAEADYAEGRRDRVSDALEQARRCTDKRVLAEALHLTLHCLLGPEFAPIRTTLANELLEVAATIGDPLATSVGLMWRTTNLLLAGHPHANRSIVQLRAALDASPHLALRYVLAAIEVMLMIRAGDFDRAAELCDVAAELGDRAGDPDVTGWYAAHVSTIRFFQGRADELLPMMRKLVGSPELSEPNDAFLGVLAVAASTAGDRWEARGALRRLRRPGLSALGRNSIWLVTLFGAVESARLLGDQDAAAEAHQLLAPYASLPTMGSFGVTCLGSTHYQLGVTAATLTKWDVAAEHFTLAMADNEALGHRPAYVLSEAGLADALSHTGDTERSAQHAARALAAAAASGMTAWRQRWNERYADGGGLRISVGCSRRGAGWVLATGEQNIEVEDSLGMRYLAALLTNPGVEIAALDLARGHSTSGTAPADEAMNQLLLDDEAKRSYRTRISDLQEQVEDAERDADIRRAEQARSELEWVITELSHATGLAGRSRAFPGNAERARTSVQKAIRRALIRISEIDADTGHLLAGAVTTGSSCVYRPFSS